MVKQSSARQSLPIVDTGIQRRNVTHLNQMNRAELKEALSDGAVYVLFTGKRQEDIGVVMGLETYQELTRDLHPVHGRGRKRHPQVPVSLPVPEAESQPEADGDANEGLDLPWR